MAVPNHPMQRLSVGLNNPRVKEGKRSIAEVCSIWCKCTIVLEGANVLLSLQRNSTIEPCRIADKKEVKAFGSFVP
jgi:hypothetical protein